MADDPPTDISLLKPRFPERADYEPVEGIGAARSGSPTRDPAPGPPKPSKSGSPGVNRPPKAPGDLLGPYFHFNTTTSDQRWLGTALVLHRKGTTLPHLSFDYDVQQESTTLYEDVFNMTATRFDIGLAIPDGFGDQPITWTLNYRGQTSSNTFNVPKWDQKWRGGFFSCNGFDETVPQETVQDLGFDNVWRHLNSVHNETPLHILIWGGDQIYIDHIFSDIPFLTRWLKLGWEEKWTHEFSEETSRYAAEYYFNSYHETWERDEVRKALQTMPSLMMWDDHDIFDGAGSYPPELHDSPVMLGLFRTAKKFRLLFQHHTTEHQANSQHRFFGVQAQNYIGQCGPRLAIVCPDGRSERNHMQVHEKDSMDMIFQKLDTELAPTTQHLIVVFAVPFSFIRVKVAEKMFAFLKNRYPWVRKLPGLRGLNSIFGLPELYDDLLDEWVHDAHIAERNKTLVRLQDFAKRKSIRVTMLSGDVHCAAFSMFRTDKATRKSTNLKPENDHRLMYSVISSAIVNVAPSPAVCMAYHYIANSWSPVDKTSESLVEMFERRPEHGKQVRHRKVMPNRNYTFFEEVGNVNPGGYGGMDESTRYRFQASEIDDSASGSSDGQNGVETNANGRVNGNGTADTRGHRHPHLRTSTALSDSTAGSGETTRDLSWHKDNYVFDRKKGYPSTLGPTSAPNGKGIGGKPSHEHSHGIFCHHRNSKLIHKKGNQMQTGVVDDSGNEAHSQESGLRIRMWLESRKKEPQGRQFSSYEVLLPALHSLERDL